jgi:hypothetical protein
MISRCRPRGGPQRHRRASGDHLGRVGPWSRCPTVTDDGTQRRETTPGAIRRAKDRQLRVIRNVKPGVCTARGTIERQDPMRKLVMISLRPVMLLLAATALAACGGAVDRAADTEFPAPASHIPTITTPTTPTPAPPNDASQAEPSDPPPPTADQTSQPAELHFACPDGGMDEAIALQHAVDQGNQPWWLSAPDVAAACTFGLPGTTVQPAGTNSYQVSHASSDQHAIVEVPNRWAQRHLGRHQRDPLTTINET